MDEFAFALRVLPDEHVLEHRSRALVPGGWLSAIAAALELFASLVKIAGADQDIICEAGAMEWVGKRRSPHLPSRARHG